MYCGLTQRSFGAPVTGYRSQPKPGLQQGAPPRSKNNSDAAPLPVAEKQVRCRPTASGRKATPMSRDGDVIAPQARSTSTVFEQLPPYASNQASAQGLLLFAAFKAPQR
jgi:hypothetical protein